MPKFFSCILYLMFIFSGWSQEQTLPSDFRQHNLIHFGANLLNATNAHDWNGPNSFAIWSRWQWQTIDGDPSTIFANYTHQINAESTAALGFLQHNTGVFLDVGAHMGYVHTFPLESNIKLRVGVNLFAFQEKLADDRFVSDPSVELPELDSSNRFLFQFSPGIGLQVDQFNVGLGFENAVGFTLSDNENEDSGNFKTVTGTLSNDFPVFLFPGWEQGFFRPVLYIKSIPDVDTQFGVSGLLSTSKFWVQGGYNSFYGASGGAGVTLAKSFSVGGLLEFGTSSSLREEDPTIEIIAAYRFGKPDLRKKVVEFDVEKEDALARERLKEEEEQKKRQELLETERAKKEEEMREQILLKQQKDKDSIAKTRLLEEKLKDSIAKSSTPKVKLNPNERYEEVESEDGLASGFYLIANVFGTQKYFKSFMLSLRTRGLEPKSFYRSANKFNYVYLQRYDTMEEARKARDSKFGGKYQQKTWIFRVK